MVAATELSRRTARSQRTAQAILDGGAECFAANGYAGTSMDAIAVAAGVTKPTVYAHFGSKDELFTRLLQARLGELDEMSLAPVATAEDVEVALIDYARRRIDAMLAQPAFGLYRAASAEGIRRPEWASALMASLATSQFERWLGRCTDAGLLLVDAPEEAAELFWSQLEGALFFPAVVGLIPIPSTAARDRVTTAAAQMFLRSFQTREITKEASP